MLPFLLACNDFTMIHETEYRFYEPHHDVFYYEAPPAGADIVMVLDGSGSMEEEWYRLYDEAHNVASALRALSIPWRFTAVSADPSEVEILRWTTPQEPNLEWDLVAHYTAVQNLGGVEEQGLDAALTTATTYGNTFTWNHDLYFIFISDEKDQSSVSPEGWLTLMQMAKVPPNKVLASSIINTESELSCGTGEKGTGYIEVSQHVMDLCEEDWGHTLDPLRQRVFTDERVFYLSSLPMEGTMKVWFGETQTYDFTYDETLNAITLDIQPMYGTSIIVTYYTN